MTRPRAHDLWDWLAPLIVAVATLVMFALIWRHAM